MKGIINSNIRKLLDSKLDKEGGGTITGKLNLYRGFNVVSLNSSTGNGAGLQGFMKILQLKILKANCNAPIEFKISRRGCKEMTTASLLFQNASTTDPNLISFVYNGNEIGAYLHKSNTSTWDLYINKTEGYDCITIVDLNNDLYYQGGRISITYPGQFVETLPSNTIKATFYNQASISLLSDKLTTPRNITLDGHFSGNFSFDGSKDIKFYLYNKYARSITKNKNNYPYHRIAKLDKVNNIYRDDDIILMLHCPYKDRFGIVEVGFRREGHPSELSKANLRWIIRSGFDYDAISIAYSNSFDNSYADVFMRSAYLYDNCVVSILDSSYRFDIGCNWILVDSNEENNTTESDKLTSYECWKSIEEAGSELHGQDYTNIDIIVDNSTVNIANVSHILDQKIQRPLDANIEIGKYKGISTMVASMSMATNKPDCINGFNDNNDGVILNLGWDTGANYGTQIAVGNSHKPHMQIRGCHDSLGWEEKWTSILDQYNYTNYINSLGAVDLGNQTLSLDELTLSDNSAKVKYYHCRLDGIGENITGRPDDNHKRAFLLKVELIRYNSSSDYHTMQTYISSYDYKVSRRFCIGGTWSGWVCDLDSRNFKWYVTPSSIGAASTKDLNFAIQNIFTNDNLCTDVNDQTLGGVYKFHPETVGTPFSGYGLIFVRKVNQWVYQDLIYTDPNDFKHYIRMKINDDNWSEWIQYQTNKIEYVYNVDILHYIYSKFVAFSNNRGYKFTVRCGDAINSPIGDGGNDFIYECYGIGETDLYNIVIAFDIRSNNTYKNTRVASTWTGWVKITDMNDLPSARVSYANDANNSNLLAGRSEEHFMRSRVYGISNEDIANANYMFPYTCDINNQTTLPSVAWYHVLFIPHSNSNGYGMQIASQFDSHNVFHRSAFEHSWGEWKPILSNDSQIVEVRSDAPVAGNRLWVW